MASRRPRPLPASGPNHVWAIDFVFDTLADGRSLKCLTVVDEWTRECLAIDVGSGIRAARVVEVLARLVSLRGAPRYLRSDNGPEFISKALLKWITEVGIQTAFIDPGKPWQNGTNESFNGRFRDECLSMEWFRSRTEAKTVIETWRQHYNTVRPHSSLGGICPTEFRINFEKTESPSREAICSFRWSNEPRHVTSGKRRSKLIGGRIYPSRVVATAAIREHVETFYNTQRRHSRLQYLCPVEFESRSHAAAFAA